MKLGDYLNNVLKKWDDLIEEGMFDSIWELISFNLWDYDGNDAGKQAATIYYEDRKWAEVYTDYNGCDVVVYTEHPIKFEPFCDSRETLSIKIVQLCYLIDAFYLTYKSFGLGSVQVNTNYATD